VMAWRITRQVHAANPLSGEGAARSGNRWNSPGVRIGYTATGRALAVLEMLVHVTRETIPHDIVLIAIEVPDEVVTELKPVPKNWNAVPYGDHARAAGNAWVRAGTSLGLLVPSAVLTREHNLLINPGHPDFGRVQFQAGERNFLDRRVFR
jgi:RES domain-containing protein